MFRSLFLRKMVFLVLVALCASALLSATLFNYAAGEVSKDNTEEIMIDKARSMAAFLGTYAEQDKTLSDSEITEKLKSISAGYASRDVLGTFSFFMMPTEVSSLLPILRRVMISAF